MANTKDPVCGMMIDSANAHASEEYEGKTYYFCSEACKSQFEKAHSPGSPNSVPAPEPVPPPGADYQKGTSRSETAKDPVCRMVVHVPTSKAQGLVSEYQGKIYHFCSQDCKARFDLAPQNYLTQGAADGRQKDTPSLGEPAHD